ncbi:MAG: hypothetical protein ACRCZF_05955, partial [Gemmataceae bacterium]
LEELRPALAMPSENLLQPVAVMQFLNAVVEYRRLLQKQAWTTQHGRLVAEVLGQPVPLAVFRSLVTTQRRALAADWQRHRRELQDQMRELRQTLAGRRASAASRSLLTLPQTLYRHPEWLPILLFVLALGVAWWRVLHR